MTPSLSRQNRRCTLSIRRRRRRRLVGPSIADPSCAITIFLPSASAINNTLQRAPSAQLTGHIYTYTQGKDKKRVFLCVLCCAVLRVRQYTAQRRHSSALDNLKIKTFQCAESD